MGYFVQKYIVEDAETASPLMPQHIALVDSKGKPVQLGSAAQATVSMPGTVKKASAVAAVQSPDSAAAAGEAPTKEEFGKVVTELNECKKQLNALLANMKSAGQMA